MRRSHPGIGGWRNENPRHFRPRNGGNQHYRPSRPYGILDTPRFPPPGSRPHRNSQSYKQRLGNDDHQHDHHPHDRTKFRSDYNRHHSYQRNRESYNHQEKQIYPLLQMRQSEPVYSNTYKKSSMYYEEPSHCHMNKMGDIDHRLIPPNREPVRRHIVSPWSHDNNVQHYDNRSHKYDQNKSDKYDSGESSKLLLYDYTGHRPPSSDHYVGNSTPAINNSDSFSRSVDDTVNIVRQRLQNRNEPHHPSSDLNYNHSSTKIQATPEKPKETISLPNFHQQEQTNKKRVQTQRQSEKIKSKIVNQLFKMDKEKLHKLMDNPNSSSKFEYAISSLITESQYSFNRHLRSVAEKSLHASSSMDFIQNDNNTIYEDTFMKQMQCILDPQDTIILEDIKPIVMAELSKVLQLDEYEQRFERGDNEVNYQQSYEQPDYNNEYSDTSYNYTEYPQSTSYEEPNSPSLTHINYRNPENPETNIENIDYRRSNEKQYKNSEKQYQNTENPYNESFLERRPRTKSCNFGESGVSVSDIRRYLRRSLDVRPTEEPMNSSASLDRDPSIFDLHTDAKPLFNSNVEQLSEEEDPFAELDRQYHVAVDPAFIQNDDSSSLHLDKDSNPPSSSNVCKDILLDIRTPERVFDDIKQEIVCQLQDIADSSRNLPSCTYQSEGDVVDTRKVPDVIKQELKDLCIEIPSHTVDSFDTEKYTSNVNYGESPKFENKTTNNETEQSDNSRLLNKSTGASVSRKRSIDQSPSHRKEKRKKVSSEQLDSNKEVPNKNIVINAKDCASKSDKSDATKSVITLFFSKQNDEQTDKAISKDTKTDNKKSHTNKHTKRKQSQKTSKQKDNETFKKKNSTESLNSSVSPKETNNLVSSNKLNIKQESKATLKTIDIFTEQPKKINLHHAHRNTALPVSSNKIVTDFKNKQVTYKPNAKHASVQVIMKKHSKEIQTDSHIMCSRFSQTEKKKFVAKGVQTDSVPTIKSTFKSNDSFERMKEIDLEIQVLLQEKFKLYSSIESKESGQNSLHSLGMTVLDVSPFEEEGKDQPAEIVLCEDSVVEGFTNIPIEELEQIALETVEETPVSNTSRPERRNRRLKAVDQCSSNSQSPLPTTPKRSCRKVKAPNISLIEQIISDDRPLEEIISFDDLESTPSKRENKTLRPRRMSKRRGNAKAKAPSPTPSSNDSCSLKPCTVLVVREDFTKYLPSQESFQGDLIYIDEADVPIGELENDVAEVPITSDIQFDMLDFSEDIVIGDNCEVKSVEDKEISESADVIISEEIILDNSQSSMEEQIGTTSDQKEDECKMYDYSADENLRHDSIVVTGNADAVLAIECIDNNFIAACLDGNVYYFSGDGQLITTLRGSNLAVTCLTIVKEKYGTTVYTGSLDSRIRYYDLDTGLEKGPECNVLSPIQTMDRAWDTVFVGTRTGFVLQFECKNNMLIPVSTVQFSDQSILALRAMKEGPRKVLLVAARSEDVTIKDAQTGLLLRTLSGPKMTVYTLLYEDGKIYCGTSSSQIHVFDYSSGTHVGAHEGGKGAVCLRAAGGLLFAGCYDGCVYVYREGERRPFAQLRGPGLMLLSLAIIDTKIIAGYKDRSLYIWKIPFSILQEMIL